MSLFSLFYEFFIISAFSVGGGYAMIPLIEKQIVAANFLTSSQVGDIIAISEMTPGPFSVNSATFAGVKSFGIIGGIVATLGVVLPSLFYATLVGKYYFKLKGNTTFECVLMGIRPISVALISSAILSLGLACINQGIFTLSYDIVAIGIGIVVFILMKKFKTSPLICLVVSGIIGVLFYSI